MALAERITLEIPENILQQARDEAHESGWPFELILQEWLQRGAAQTEAEWEEATLEASLGDAIGADGSINFDRLR